MISEKIKAKMARLLGPASEGRVKVAMKVCSILPERVNEFFRIYGKKIEGSCSVSVVVPGGDDADIELSLPNPTLQKEVDGGIYKDVAPGSLVVVMTAIGGDLIACSADEAFYFIDVNLGSSGMKLLANNLEGFVDVLKKTDEDERPSRAIGGWINPNLFKGRKK